MPKVFLSYSRADMNRASELEHTLSAQGVSVWRDQHGIYGGQQWPKAIGEAIADCDAVLLLWSAHSAASHFVEFEWTTALALKKIIIPCLVDETGLPPALAAVNGIAIHKVPEAAPRILAALSGQTQPRDDARCAQVIKQLQRVTAAEPEEALAQAKALFNQGSLHAGGHVIQTGGDVTINENRQHTTLLAAALIVIAVVALSALYFISRAVQPPPPVEETTYLRGQVDDADGNPISGAAVRVDEITGKSPMQITTTSSGGFVIEKIPARIRDHVRVYVSKEGYEAHDRYVPLPGPLNVKLKRKR